MNYLPEVLYLSDITLALSALKIARVLRPVRRTFGSSNPAGIVTAFKALVQPLLGYAYLVWNPCLVKHILTIEPIQTKVSRLTCGRENAYTERLTEMNWDSLKLKM